MMTDVIVEILRKLKIRMERFGWWMILVGRYSLKTAVPFSMCVSWMLRIARE